jgi:hypothetical protein
MEAVAGGVPPPHRLATRQNLPPLESATHSIGVHVINVEKTSDDRAVMRAHQKCCYHSRSVRSFFPELRVAES